MKRKNEAVAAEAPLLKREKTTDMNNKEVELATMPPEIIGTDLLSLYKLWFLIAHQFRTQS